MTQGATAQNDIPWTLRDVAKGLGVVGLFLAFLLLALVVALSLWGGRGTVGQLSLVLVISLLVEFSLFAVVHRFTVRKYHCSWQTLGFRYFRAEVGVPLVLLVVLGGLMVNSLYLGLVTAGGWRPLEPPPLPPLFGRGLLNGVLATVMALLVAPVTEEAFFRGFLLLGVGARFGWVWGSLSSASLFALGHGQLGTVVPIFLLGLLLAWLYLRTRSLWTCIMAHFGYNLTNLLGLLGAVS